MSFAAIFSPRSLRKRRAFLPFAILSGFAISIPIAGTAPRASAARPALFAERFSFFVAQFVASFPPVSRGSCADVPNNMRIVPI